MLRFNFLFLFSFFVSSSVFALNLNDFKSKSFKDEGYQLSFKIEQSDHGTKNALFIDLKCRDLREKVVGESKSHEVCNIDYKSVKIKKTRSGYLVNYSVLMDVDWGHYYKAMSKGRDISPKCSKESKKTFKLEISSCK